MKKQPHIKSPHWPRLDESNHHKTSCRDGTYNCFAYAARVTNDWWDPSNKWHWPKGAPRGTQVESVISAWATMGYEVCTNGTLEAGYEKVAFYVKSGKVQHAARQSADGKWLSKLGSLWDIEHNTPEDLEGPMYGEVATYMRKRVGATFEALSP